ncbi:MAG: hypothetical protein JW893_08210 [Candidatus Omnitrophica bacterium]|nr:hypothetical protein [Candidatus Omnitrophota bacterium]
MDVPAEKDFNQPRPANEKLDNTFTVRADDSGVVAVSVTDSKEDVTTTFRMSGMFAAEPGEEALVHLWGGNTGAYLGIGAVEPVSVTANGPNRQGEIGGSRPFKKNEVRKGSALISVSIPKRSELRATEEFGSAAEFNQFHSFFSGENEKKRKYGEAMAFLAEALSGAAQIDSDRAEQIFKETYLPYLITYIPPMFADQLRSRLLDTRTPFLQAMAYLIATPEQYELEQKLRVRNAVIRQEAALKLAGMIKAGEIFVSPLSLNNNVHVHSKFSYAPYYPEEIAYRLRRAGLRNGGIIDHDTGAGIPDFSQAADQFGIKSTSGLEMRLNLNGVVVDGVDFSKLILNAPGVANMVYFLSHAVPNIHSPRAQRLRELLLAMRASKEARNRKMIAGVNEKLEQLGIAVSVDYDRDIQPLAEDGNTTDRHLMAGLAGLLGAYKKAYEKILGPERIKDAEKAVLAFKAGDIDVPMSMLRSVFLMPGTELSCFIQPDEIENPAMADAVDVIKKAGGIPVYAFLGDSDRLKTDEARNLVPLFKYLVRIGVLGIAIMPHRNSSQEIEEVIKLAGQYGLKVFSGVDINQPTMPFLEERGLVELPKVAASQISGYSPEVAKAFLTGGDFLVGHEFLGRFAGMGYYSEALTALLPDPEERFLFLSSIGAKSFGELKNLRDGIAWSRNQRNFIEELIASFRSELRQKEGGQVRSIPFESSTARVVNPTDSRSEQRQVVRTLAVPDQEDQARSELRLANIEDNISEAIQEAETAWSEQIHSPVELWRKEELIEFLRTIFDPEIALQAGPIFVPRAVVLNEARMGLTPIGIKFLRQIDIKNPIYVEAGAGINRYTGKVYFLDEEYRAAGAEVLEHDKFVSRAQASKEKIVVSIKDPRPSEYDLLDNAVLFTYLHLAASKQLTADLLARVKAAVAYETIAYDDHGVNKTPVLRPASHAAGWLSAVRYAVFASYHRSMNSDGLDARFLEVVEKYPRILQALKGSLEGKKLMVLGGGVAGEAAAVTFAEMGATVVITEVNETRIRELQEIIAAKSLGSKILVLKRPDPKMHPNLPPEILGHLRKVNGLVGAILVEGAVAPREIDDALYDELAKLGLLEYVADIAIDQGGNIAGSTAKKYHDGWISDERGIQKFTITNMPSAIPLHVSVGLEAAKLAYLVVLLMGPEKAAKTKGFTELARGFNLYKGAVTHSAVAKASGLPFVPLEEAMQQSNRSELRMLSEVINVLGESDSGLVSGGRLSLMLFSLAVFGVVLGLIVIYMDSWALTLPDLKKKSVDELIEMLSTAGSGVRHDVIIELGNRGDVRAIPHLEALKNDFAEDEYRRDSEDLRNGWIGTLETPGYDNRPVVAEALERLQKIQGNSGSSGFGAKPSDDASSKPRSELHSGEVTGDTRQVTRVGMSPVTRPVSQLSGRSELRNTSRSGRIPKINAANRDRALHQLKAIQAVLGQKTPEERRDTENQNMMTASGHETYLIEHKSPDMATGHVNTISEGHWNEIWKFLRTHQTLVRRGERFLSRSELRSIPSKMRLLSPQKLLEIISGLNHYEPELATDSVVAIRELIRRQSIPDLLIVFTVLHNIFVPDTCQRILEMLQKEGSSLGVSWTQDIISAHKKDLKGLADYVRKNPSFSTRRAEWAILLTALRKPGLLKLFSMLDPESVKTTEMLDRALKDISKVSSYFTSTGLPNKRNDIIFGAINDFLANRNRRTEELLGFFEAAKTIAARISDQIPEFLLSSIESTDSETGAVLSPQIIREFNPAFSKELKKQLKTLADTWQRSELRETISFLQPVLDFASNHPVWAILLSISVLHMLLDIFLGLRHFAKSIRYRNYTSFGRNAPRIEKDGLIFLPMNLGAVLFISWLVVPDPEFGTLVGPITNLFLFLGLLLINVLEFSGITGPLFYRYNPRKYQKLTRNQTRRSELHSDQVTSDMRQVTGVDMSPVTRSVSQLSGRSELRAEDPKGKKPTRWNRILRSIFSPDDHPKDYQRLKPGQIKQFSPEELVKITLGLNHYEPELATDSVQAIRELIRRKSVPDLLIVLGRMNGDLTRKKVLEILQQEGRSLGVSWEPQIIRAYSHDLEGLADYVRRNPDIIRRQKEWDILLAALDKMELLARFSKLDTEDITTAGMLAQALQEVSRVWPSSDDIRDNLSAEIRRTKIAPWNVQHSISYVVDYFFLKRRNCTVQDLLGFFEEAQELAAELAKQRLPTREKPYYDGMDLPEEYFHDELSKRLSSLAAMWPNSKPHKSSLGAEIHRTFLTKDEAVAQIVGLFGLSQDYINRKLELVKEDVLGFEVFNLNPQAGSPAYILVVSADKKDLRADLFLVKKGKEGHWASLTVSESPSRNQGSGFMSAPLERGSFQFGMFKDSAQEDRPSHVLIMYDRKVMGSQKMGGILERFTVRQSAESAELHMENINRIKAVYGRAASDFRVIEDVIEDPGHHASFVLYDGHEPFWFQNLATGISGVIVTFPELAGRIRKQMEYFREKGFETVIVLEKDGFGVKKQDSPEDIGASVAQSVRDYADRARFIVDSAVKDSRPGARNDIYISVFYYPNVTYKRTERSELHPTESSMFKVQSLKLDSQPAVNLEPLTLNFEPVLSSRSELHQFPTEIGTAQSFGPSAQRAELREEQPAKPAAARAGVVTAYAPEYEGPSWQFSIKQGDHRRQDFYVHGVEHLKRILQVLGFKDLSFLDNVDMRSYNAISQAIQDHMPEDLKLMNGQYIRILEASDPRMKFMDSARGTSFARLSPTGFLMTDWYMHYLTLLNYNRETGKLDLLQVLPENALELARREPQFTHPMASLRLNESTIIVSSIGSQPRLIVLKWSGEKWEIRNIVEPVEDPHDISSITITIGIALLKLSDTEFFLANRGNNTIRRFQLDGDKLIPKEVLLPQKDHEGGGQSIHLPAAMLWLSKNKFVLANIHDLRIFTNNGTQFVNTGVIVSERDPNGVETISEPTALMAFAERTESGGVESFLVGNSGNNTLRRFTALDIDKDRWVPMEAVQPEYYSNKPPTLSVHRESYPTISGPTDFFPVAPDQMIIANKGGGNLALYKMTGPVLDWPFGEDGEPRSELRSQAARPFGRISVTAPQIIELSDQARGFIFHMPKNPTYNPESPVMFAAFNNWIDGLALKDMQDEAFMNAKAAQTADAIIRFVDAYREKTGDENASVALVSYWTTKAGLGLSQGHPYPMLMEKTRQIVVAKRPDIVFSGEGTMQLDAATILATHLSKIYPGQDAAFGEKLKASGRFPARIFMFSNFHALEMAKDTLAFMESRGLIDAYLQRLESLARAKHARIVIPEALSPDVLRAVAAFLQKDIGEVILLGDAAAVQAAAEKAGVDVSRARVIDPVTRMGQEWKDSAGKYFRLNFNGMPEEAITADMISTGWRTLDIQMKMIKKVLAPKIAKGLLRGPEDLFYGAWMMASGEADAMVSGKEYDSEHVIYAMKMLVGMAEGVRHVSAAELYSTPYSVIGTDGTFMLADITTNQNPDANVLVEIAVSTARNIQRLISPEVRLAFVFGKGEESGKIEQAITQTKEKLRELGIRAEIADRPMGVDEALRGGYNGLIGPDLDASNTQYKNFQWFSGFATLSLTSGGAAKSMHDLSRGATAEEIEKTMEVAVALSEPASSVLTPPRSEQRQEEDFLDLVLAEIDKAKAAEIADQLADLEAMEGVLGKAGEDVEDLTGEDLKGLEEDRLSIEERFERIRKAVREDRVQEAVGHIQANITLIEQTFAFGFDLEVSHENQEYEKRVAKITGPLERARTLLEAFLAGQRKENVPERVSLEITQAKAAMPVPEDNDALERQFGQAFDQILTKISGDKINEAIADISRIIPALTNAVDVMASHGKFPRQRPSPSPQERTRQVNAHLKNAQGLLIAFLAGRQRAELRTARRSKLREMTEPVEVGWDELAKTVDSLIPEVARRFKSRDAKGPYFVLTSQFPQREIHAILGDHGAQLGSVGLDQTGMGNQVVTSLQSLIGGTHDLGREKFLIETFGPNIHVTVVGLERSELRANELGAQFHSDSISKEEVIARIQKEYGIPEPVITGALQPIEGDSLGVEIFGFEEGGKKLAYLFIADEKEKNIRFNIFLIEEHQWNSDGRITRLQWQDPMSIAGSMGPGFIKSPLQFGMFKTSANADRPSEVIRLLNGLLYRHGIPEKAGDTVLTFKSSSRTDSAFGKAATSFRVVKGDLVLFNEDAPFWVIDLENGDQQPVVNFKELPEELQDIANGFPGSRPQVTFTFERHSLDSVNGVNNKNIGVKVAEGIRDLMRKTSRRAEESLFRLAYKRKDGGEKIEIAVSVFARSEQRSLPFGRDTDRHFGTGRSEDRQVARKVAVQNQQDSVRSELRTDWRAVSVGLIRYAQEREKYLKDEYVKSAGRTTRPQEDVIAPALKETGERRFQMIEENPEIGTIELIDSLIGDLGRLSERAKSENWEMAVRKDIINFHLEAIYAEVSYLEMASRTADASQVAGHLGHAAMYLLNAITTRNKISFVGYLEGKPGAGVNYQLERAAHFSFGMLTEEFKVRIDNETLTGSDIVGHFGPLMGLIQAILLDEASTYGLEVEKEPRAELRQKSYDFSTPPGTGRSELRGTAEATVEIAEQELVKTVDTYVQTAKKIIAELFTQDVDFQELITWLEHYLETGQYDEAEVSILEAIRKIQVAAKRTRDMAKEMKLLAAREALQNALDFLPGFDEVDLGASHSELREELYFSQAGRFRQLEDAFLEQVDRLDASVKGRLADFAVGAGQYHNEQDHVELKKILDAEKVQYPLHLGVWTNGRNVVMGAQKGAIYRSELLILVGHLLEKERSELRAGFYDVINPLQSLLRKLRAKFKGKTGLRAGVIADLDEALRSVIQANRGRDELWNLRLAHRSIQKAIEHVSADRSMKLYVEDMAALQQPLSELISLKEELVGASYQSTGKREKIETREQAIEVLGSIARNLTAVRQTVDWPADSYALLTTVTNEVQLTKSLLQQGNLHKSVLKKAIQGLVDKRIYIETINDGLLDAIRGNDESLKKHAADLISQQGRVAEELAKIEQVIAYLEEQAGKPLAERSELRAEINDAITQIEALLNDERITQPIRENLIRALTVLKYVARGTNVKGNLGFAQESLEAALKAAWKNDDTILLTGKIFDAQQLLSWPVPAEQELTVAGARAELRSEVKEVRTDKQAVRLMGNIKTGLKKIRDDADMGWQDDSIRLFNTVISELNGIQVHLRQGWYSNEASFDRFREILSKQLENLRSIINMVRGTREETDALEERIGVEWDKILFVMAYFGRQAEQRSELRAEIKEIKTSEQAVKVLESVAGSLTQMTQKTVWADDTAPQHFRNAIEQISLVQASIRMKDFQKGNIRALTQAQDALSEIVKMLDSFSRRSEQAFMQQIMEMMLTRGEISGEQDKIEKVIRYLEKQARKPVVERSEQRSEVEEIKTSEQAVKVLGSVARKLSKMVQKARWPRGANVLFKDARAQVRQVQASIKTGDRHRNILTKNIRVLTEARESLSGIDTMLSGFIQGSDIAFIREIGAMVAWQEKVTGEQDRIDQVIAYLEEQAEKPLAERSELHSEHVIGDMRQVTGIDVSPVQRHVSQKETGYLDVAGILTEPTELVMRVFRGMIAPIRLVKSLGFKAYSWVVESIVGKPETPATAAELVVPLSERIESFLESLTALYSVIVRRRTDEAARMVIDRRLEIPDVSEMIPLIPYLASHPRLKHVLLLVATPAQIRAFRNELRIAATNQLGLDVAALKNFDIQPVENERGLKVAVNRLISEAQVDTALVSADERLTESVGYRPRLLRIKVDDSVDQNSAVLIAAQLLDELTLDLIQGVHHARDLIHAQRWVSLVEDMKRLTAFLTAA